MPEKQNIEVPESRKEFLRKLQEEVDLAFKKRAFETEIESGDTTVEQLNEHRKTIIWCAFLSG